LFTLLGLTLIAGLLFFDKDLKLWAARFYYHPENSLDPWFEQTKSLWTFFYYAAPWLTGLLILGSISVFATALFLNISSGGQSITEFQRRSRPD
jgi:lipid A 4'-phosphatase